MSGKPASIGKYEILAEIGRGGMGVVYKAKDPVLDRVIALKTMFREVLDEPGMRERFLREARSAARLQHPNIVTVYEFGEVDGAPFIAMEFLEGENLAAAMDRRRFPDLVSKVKVVEQLCDGLGYAHQHGVIHRDVKPTNVSLLPRDVVKIVDFGIAWLEGGTLATRTGQILGTPTYMAPEQFTGEPIDHRVDVWAVGVIMYELLTGHRPFDAGTIPSLIYKIVHAMPPPMDQRAQRLPVRLVEVVERAMAKDPRQRFLGLEPLARALREVREVLSGAAPVEAGSETATVVKGQSADTLDETLQAPVGGGLARLPTAPTLVAPRSVISGHAMPFIEGSVFGEARRLQAVRLSPDDSLLAAGGIDGSISLWDLETRMKVATFRNRVHLRTGHGSLTTTLAFSTDGSLLASGHLDGAVYVWEVATGWELDARLRHEGAVGGLAFTPDGQTLVSAGADATLKFWELDAVRAGDPRRLLRRQPEAATCMTLARNGRVVATGHSNRVVRLHDTASHRLVATLHGHRTPISAIAASPSGELVASGGRDGVVRVQHVDTRELAGSHHEHGRAVSSLLFFPDGKQVVSVAMDRVLVIWDLTRPEEPVSLTGTAEESLAGVCLTRDGRRLICGCAEGHFRVWVAVS